MQVIRSRLVRLVAAVLAVQLAAASTSLVLCCLTPVLAFYGLVPDLPSSAISHPDAGRPSGPGANLIDGTFPPDAPPPRPFF